MECQGLWLRLSHACFVRSWEGNTSWSYKQSPEKGFALQIFNKKQAAERKDGWVMGNNLFFRMHRISDIYFVGGFGTVQWVDVAEYAATTPDSIVLDNPHKTLQVISMK